MIKLESSQMTAAIERAKAVKPRVRRIADRTYAVTGSKGDVYTVRFAVANGHKLAECDCKAGQSNRICYHIAAAAAVNIALHSAYSKPAPAPVQTPVPAPAEKEIIITPSPRGYHVIFPHKPGEAAIKSFHRLGMVWQRPLDGDVYWCIPAAKLAEAIETIAYWYKLPVRVADSAPAAEAVLVKPQRGGVRIEGWLV